MDKARTTSYKDAGVDVQAGEDFVERIRGAVEATRTGGVLGAVGGFGGLFAPDLTGLREPVLVSSADGVGTKLKLAFATGGHAGVGADLVRHCANDIAVLGQGIRNAGDAISMIQTAEGALQVIDEKRGVRVRA